MRWGDHLLSGFYYKLLSDGKLAEEDKEPEIAGLDFYFDAFRELGTCRQVGMGLGPIPFTAIAEYFRLFLGDDETEFEEFCWVIRMMDRIFLKHAQEKSAEKAQKKSGASKNGSGKSNSSNPRRRR